MKKVTAKEIAEVAQVSTATVSRIMSGHGGHRFSTVKKVENAARELGIKLNLFCPGTDCVGIITHAAYDFNCTPYSTALLSSALKRLAVNGFTAEIIPVIPSRLSFSYVVRLVNEHRLRGLILLEYANMHHLSLELQSLSIPVICVGNMEEQDAHHAVYCKNDQSGALAAAGFEREVIRHVNAGIITLKNPDSCHLMRINSFTRSWEAKNRRKVTWVHKLDPQNIDGGLAIIDELCAMPLSMRPTAIFITHSMPVRSILQAAQNQLRIPGDISVISIEDDAELIDYYDKIGIVRQPTRELGDAGAKLLIELINDSGAGQNVILNCELAGQCFNTKGQT